MAETENKYVKPITLETKQAIVDTSVQSMNKRPTSDETAMKKRFVQPIVNLDNTPCLADEVDRVATEANYEIDLLNKQAADFDIGLGVQLGLINKNKEDIADVLTQVNSLNDRIDSFKLYEIVSSLPASGDTNKLYLVPSFKQEEDNVLEEWLWVNGAWEMVGTMKASTIENLKNGTGKGAVQQVADGVENGFDFTGKNPNAEKLDATLSGIQPYGATGDFASAFNGKSSAPGKRSFSCNTTTIAKGDYSFASGDNSAALSPDSHVEGYQNVTSAPKDVDNPELYIAQHAEGIRTQALGWGAHSQNSDTIAKGNNTHAGGSHTIAEWNDQTVIGRYNANKYGNLFEVGNGTSEDNRSNAFEVKEDGTAYAGGTRLLKEGEASGGTKLYQHTIYGATISDKTDYFLSLIVNVGEQLTTDSIIGLLCNPSYRTMFCLSKIYSGWIPIVTAMQVGLTEVALTLYDGTSKTIDVGDSARGIYTITEL